MLSLIVTLIGLCNFEAWVRSEVARLIQLFSCHEFRTLETQDEKDKEAVPFMVDYINLKPPDTPPTTPELLSVPVRCSSPTRICFSLSEAHGLISIG
jgi:hypothetical protein